MPTSPFTVTFPALAAFTLLTGPALVTAQSVAQALGTSSTSPGAVVVQQPPDPPDGLFIGAGLGVVRGSLDVSGTTGSGGGLAPAIQLSSIRNGMRRHAVDLLLEPFEVPNLRRAEHYTAYTVLGSRYFGPLGIGIGFQRRTWGGSNVYVDTDWGPALGISLAPELFVLGDWVIAGDFFGRVSGGEEISTSVVGIRVLIGRILSREP